MARPAALSSLKTGIQRLRWKGGARADSLYDLVNAYLDASGAPVGRQGTKRSYKFQAGTSGLMVHKGQRVVFASRPIGGSIPAKYRVEVLRHPTNPDAEILTINFAKPFLGYPLVSATFNDGATYTYWLQDAGKWTPNTVVKIGQAMKPTDETQISGYAYQAQRLNPPSPYWEPNQPRSVGQVFEPTEYNGYAYEVVEVTGTNASSGNAEPSWIEAEGALVYEEVDLVSQNGTLTPGANDPSSTSGGTDGRYSGGAGSGSSPTNQQAQ